MWPLMVTFFFFFFYHEGPKSSHFLSSVPLILSTHALSYISYNKPNIQKMHGHTHHLIQENNKDPAIADYTTLGKKWGNINYIFPWYKQDLCGCLVCEEYVLYSEAFFCSAYQDPINALRASSCISFTVEFYLPLFHAPPSQNSLFFCTLVEFYIHF